MKNTSQNHTHPATPLLQELGLHEQEAALYLLLLTQGPQKARDLTAAIGIGRGNVYNYLMMLVQKGLVSAIEGKQTRYEAADPAKLEQLLAQKKQGISNLEGMFQQLLPTLTSAFNLSTGKPTVQVYEGVDGYKLALQDVLTSKTDILTYIDADALTGPLATIDAWFTKERERRGIRQRILVADTPGLRQAFSEKTAGVEVRFLKNFANAYRGAMELYDHRIAYFSLTAGKSIAFIIQEQTMYELHRQQFEFLWTTASPQTMTEEPTPAVPAQKRHT